MAETGVTAEGFVRERMPEIRRAITEALRNNLIATGFSGDIETRPDSLYGLIIDTFAEREAALWEMAEQVYYAMYPGSATGTSLDRATSFAGVTRLSAEPSRCNVVLYGAQNTTVPAGAQIRNGTTNTLWQLVDAATISAQNAIDVQLQVNAVADGSYTVTIDGTSYTHAASGETRQQILNGLEIALSGAGMTVSNNGALLSITGPVQNFAITTSANLSVARLGTQAVAETIEPMAEATQPGDLGNIVTLVTGWDAVDNLTPGTVGRVTETDDELRARYALGVFRLGGSTQPAIEANIRDSVLGVTAVRVFQNTSDAVQDELLPHSVQVVVQGGLDNDIAGAIYQQLAAGIDTNGQIEVTLDTQQGEQTIKFDRPEPVYVWVDVAITLLGPEEGEVFPSSGFEQIRQSLGAITQEIGFDVLPQRYLRAVFDVPGIASAELKVYADTDPNAAPTPEQFTADPVTIDRDQIAVLSAARMNVT